jgi:hypothetical protein
VAALERLVPWRLSARYWAARGTIEVPAGTVRTSGTRPGDLRRIEPGEGAEVAPRVRHAGAGH